MDPREQRNPPRPHGRLAVCYPWGSPFIWSAFAENMANLARPPGWAVRFIPGEGHSPANRHNDMCAKALLWGADLVCIIGADQVHPEDMLPRLVSRIASGYEGRTVDAVAALVPTRGYVGTNGGAPFQPMAWRIAPNVEKGGNGTVRASHTPRVLSPGDGSLQVVTPEDGPMVKIDFIGSGVFMLRASLLRALPLPWFKERIIDEAMQAREPCMDTLFVYRLSRELHANVWVDTTLEVKHIHPFQIDRTFSERFADWAIPGRGDRSCDYGPAYRRARAEELKSCPT